MKKNVVVVDEFGHEYEATYPKRAKGLVKSGRARFVDANRICLLRPPEQNLEDKHMEQNTSALTAREIFDQIVKLQNDLKNIRETTELIQTIRDTNQYNGNEIDSHLKQLDKTFQRFVFERFLPIVNFKNYVERGIDET